MENVILFNFNDFGLKLFLFHFILFSLCSSFILCFYNFVIGKIQLPHIGDDVLVKSPELKLK